MWCSLFRGEGGEVLTVGSRDKEMIDVSNLDVASLSIARKERAGRWAGEC
jgi:hypothetical protein